MGRIADIIGSLSDTFRIGKATLDASGLTAARTHQLPDESGRLALDAPTIVAKVVTATTYTIVAGDAGVELQFPNGGTVTLDASALTAGDIGLIRQTGTATVTVTSAPSTTIYPATARTTAGQGYLLSWRVDSTTVAYVNGEVAV